MLCAQPWSIKYTQRSFNRELNPMSSLSFMADYREQKFSHLSLMESVMSLSVKCGWALRLFLAKRAWRKWLGVFLMRSCASLAASASVSQKTCSKNLESHIRSLSICTLRPPWRLWRAQATRRFLEGRRELKKEGAGPLAITFHDFTSSCASTQAPWILSQFFNYSFLAIPKFPVTHWVKRDMQTQLTSLAEFSCW